MNIKPLIIVSARNALISGGYRRIYEVLKRGKSEGINYTIVIDIASYRNYTKMFADFADVCRQYKSYIIHPQNIRLLTPKVHGSLKTAITYMDFFQWALTISKIAREEDVDLIVGPSESSQIVWISYLSGRMCHKPWTAIFQGKKDLFDPTPTIGPLNPFNVLNHVSQKKLANKIRFLSKIGFSIELLGLLKIAEKSLILAVSASLSEEIRFLNPRIQFHVIVPGNGIDLGKFNKKSITTPLYDAIFFSRLTPEKGLFDLPEIYKLVVQRFPKARMLVAGIVENPEFLEDFRRMILQYDLTNNIVFLGQQDQHSLIDLVCSSKLTIYPSTLDAFPLVVLESLACGTPVATYDIPAIKHNFGACKAVLRCPIKDNASMAKIIEFLLVNEDLRSRLSKEAKEYVGNYDWRNVVRVEKEAYFKVIEWFNSKTRR
jgi:glycosyltransferase involved in cell wall biosynthesis